MTFKLSKNSINNSAGIDPRLVEIRDRALQISKVDFGHPRDAGLRTAERQNELFKNKVSQCDGYENLSYHQSGLALDFYAFVDGSASWHPPHLTMVAAAFLQAASELGYELEWGGLWSTGDTVDGVAYGWDCGHIQLKTNEV